MKIKICGLTKTEEAAYLNRNQVDLAGFVMFFPKSRRNITPQKAAEIMKALSPSIQKVAVVVSPSLGQLYQIEETGFDYIQIHGELLPEVLEAARLPILRAFNGKDIGNYALYRSHPKIAGYVFDALEPGSGQSFDWTELSGLPRDGRLFLLAGGLHPGNVAAAIRAVRPDGVDVSSGVEYENGRGKDAAKVDAFVSEVRKACHRPDFSEE